MYVCASVRAGVGARAHLLMCVGAGVLVRACACAQRRSAILVAPYEAGRLCTYGSVVKPYTVSAAHEGGR